MSESARVEYDRVFYPGAAFAQTHPDRLAVMATLFGMEPATIARARVLEIGCTDGGNLIPMAYALPDAEFVGIDISARALEAGRECVTSLGLRNIALRELDILEVAPDFGSFDYIIAHGVFSWIPSEVREKVLAICRAHLAPHGVAYISYNAYPGCHLRDLTRSMMLYHVRETEDPDAKRESALRLLRFLVEAQPAADSFQQLLVGELERIEKKSPAVFYHDDLAGTRAAFYFHEFVSLAAKHDLQYLSEAEMPDMVEEAFSPQVVETLDTLASDRLGREQYLDFLKCRRFRQTLLCHREVVLTEPTGARVRRLFLSSQAKATSAEPRLDPEVEEEFVMPVKGGAQVKTRDTLVKAAMLELAERWPESIHFDQLMGASEARSAAENARQPTDGSELADALLAFYRAGLIDLQTIAPRLAAQVSARPVLSPIARWQLANGSADVTNLRHHTVRFDDPIAIQLMLLLDGMSDRATIVQELARFCREHRLLRDATGSVIRDRPTLASLLEAGLGENLQKLARRCLLVA